MEWLVVAACVLFILAVFFLESYVVIDLLARMFGSRCFCGGHFWRGHCRNCGIDRETCEAEFGSHK